MNRRVNSGGLVLAVAMLAGCAQPPKLMYMWEAFPRQQYEFLLREGVSASSQISAMEAHAEKARAAGASLPPGFRAHLGMLQLSVGDAEQARQLWQAEKVSFPESAPYMDHLLKRLQGSPAKNENPA